MNKKISKNIKDYQEKGGEIEDNLDEKREKILAMREQLLNEIKNYLKEDIKYCIGIRNTDCYQVHYSFIQKQLEPKIDWE